MKNRLFIIGLLVFIFNNISYTQSIKKILTQDELNKLEKSDTIFKYLDNVTISEFEGFTGVLLVKRIEHDYKTIEVGKWTRKNSKYGYDAIMTWDSAGRLLDYKEFNKNNTLFFDCKYWYETKNGNYYRLEKMLINDENGNTFTKGFRYWQVKIDKFGFYYQLKKQKFGTWEYFDNAGNLIKTKDYGVIK